jgi:hypothetical protein
MHAVAIIHRFGCAALAGALNARDRDKHDNQISICILDGIGVLKAALFAE